jgi:hypothetical protein
MSDRLTDEQLIKVVAEATRLSQQDEFNTEQVKEVLAELNLSPELLDDALAQLKRREALATRRRRMAWLSLGGAIALLGGLAIIGVTRWHYQQLVDQVEVVQDRLTLAQDDGGTVQRVNRQRNPELYYRVTLSDAPVNRTLSLSCEWTAPTGEVIRENRYKTQRITTSTWDTRCRHSIGPASPQGDWTVEMFVGDRPLSRNTFEVE